MKRFSLPQTGFAAAGSLLMSSAVYSLTHGKEDLVKIAVPLGISMLLVGIISILIYFAKRRTFRSAHWLLADGMSTALLSIFLLFNRIQFAAVIPFFCGIWELFSGVLKVVDSRELYEEKIHGWQSYTAVGTIEILLGTVSLLKPLETVEGMHVTVAVVLIIQSVGFLFKIINYPRLINE